jgi:hypothetical protein
MLTRRMMAGGVAGIAGAVFLPQPAAARFWPKFRQWGELLGALANVLTIVGVAVDAVKGTGASASRAPICSVDVNVLSKISHLCFQLSLVTNTRDYQAAIEIGDGGLLPALVVYSEKPDPSNWRRVRNETLIFLNTAQQLLHEFERTGGVVSALDPDTRARVLAEARNALRLVNDAIETIHYAGEGPTPEDSIPVKQALVNLGPFPRLLERAQRASAELIDMRTKAKC